MEGGLGRLQKVKHELGMQVVLCSWSGRREGAEPPGKKQQCRQAKKQKWAQASQEEAGSQGTQADGHGPPCRLRAALQGFQLTHICCLPSPQSKRAAGAGGPLRLCSTAQSGTQLVGVGDA
jgi:hypothetical protein